MNEIIKKQISHLPRTPGVYIFRGAQGKVIYVGKATVLKTRVSSYFQSRKKRDPSTPLHSARDDGGGIVRPIEQAIDEIITIEAIKTDTVIEALMLEAELIKKFWPTYNVLGKDGRSYLYVGITRDEFPKVLLVRGKELIDGIYNEKNDFTILFGPYTQATSIRQALKIIRKIFPFSTCKPPKKGEASRACFYRGIGLCPGVCTGEIKKRPYRVMIRRLIKFFQGKKKDILIDLKKDMKKAAAHTDFEAAVQLRNQIQALEHIQDIAMIKADKNPHVTAKIGIDIFGRIEGYDISNMSGEHAVGSMVVAVGGHPEKQEYRKFTIKTVQGSNDVAMLEEVIRRRFTHEDWEKPELLLIDGGLPQVNRVRAVMRELQNETPVIGIAKGAARKKNQFVIPKQKKHIQEDLKQIARLYPHILIALRDESHRFAQNFYRSKHRKTMKKG